ncbi:hypothetical protein J7E79_15510 [Bacillus sp. ISL-40]|uniref:DUF6155 family protein n=1 Tax=unclassified Bacillus (in: firmicutes) TaxID=185979 RepID=UPI001BE569B9|nr:MULTISPECIES: DUF6155 family protein [unclassified Bacillus (in: firmicutes)]MBT2698809.1 hypothetical protein [Bacillus sp. ISL-40]MBT2720748.1 hypothetical protein [Bacillus sp. ISL-46]MBT2740975.1 hypothetical protein [Bacillus sp. ISL-77]
MVKIKITDLKKQLKEYEKKELIELVVEMFKANKDVQNFLSSKFLGNEAIEVLFQQARKKIQNEFFPEKGHGKLRLAEAKKEITAFKKATNDEKRTVDLMLFYVEQGVDFTCSYGDIDANFYSSMVKMFDQVAMECDQNEEFYREFSTRLSKVVSMADGTGWGFYEAFVECYYTIEWVHEEDE